MRKYKDFEETKKSARYQGSSQLPLGTYVCKVKAVRVIDEDTEKERIEILYDVAEGDQKDFFKKAYDASSSEDKKWKGRVLIWSPLDDGSESDGWTKNTHAKWMNAFEDSNKGYRWNWDASKLKDKLFGITLRVAGKCIDGKHVKYNEIAYPCSVEDAKANPTRAGKEKLYSGFDEKIWQNNLNSSNNSKDSQDDFINVPEGVDEEIPF